jgi:two-component system, NtrC family, response regulator PilR
MDSNRAGNDHIGWIRNSQRLLNSLNVGYILTDLDNVILEINDALIRLSGYKRENFIGRRLNDFFLESDLEKLRSFDKRAGEFEDINAFFQYEWFSRNPVGEVIPILCSISANFDKNGKPVTFNNLVSDISELKKAQSALENEKKLLEAVLFGIGDCVTVFSVSGEILIKNPEGETIRGTRNKPLLALAQGNQKSLDLKVGKEIRSYDARIEAVHDEKGEIFAYVETLTNTTDRKKLEKQTQELNRIRRSMSRREMESTMIGKSQAIQKVFDLVLKCAEVDSNILILGETGVGKEMAARFIHSLSRRKEQPFVAVNCGALPDSLLESELFGHVKGAFTGAISDRSGLFREASGGILFLDEIGDISSQMQVKLLRALQEKEVRPLGDSRKYAVDVRVITATNKDLDQLMRREQFRTDLYYRIAVIPLIIPPLRDRGDDILLLARHFIEKYCKRSDHPPKIISHKSQELLMRYPWPGNIRELENSIEYALAMSKSDTLRSTDFPFNLLSGNKPSEKAGKTGDPVAINPVQAEMAKPPVIEKTALSRLSGPTPEEEKEAILSALNNYFGNRDLAARALGISRVSLWRKMKKHGLSGWKYQKDCENGSS